MIQKHAILLVLVWAMQGINVVYAEKTQPLYPVPNKPQAADFTLKDSDGKVHQLGKYRGRVVIVNFWTTWCPPCRFELPSMERAYEQLKKEGIEILAINVGEDADTIFTFTADYPVTFPLLMDLDSSVINDYPVVGLPTTFVIGPEGRLIYRAIGTREWDDGDLLKQIRALNK
ncbi:MAG: TlpA disulfide reductase family protein [Gammaproteobacteria bacterium]|jgi:peroxiredoxin